MKPCDMKQTAAVRRLLSVPPGDRDDAWRIEFYDHVREAGLARAEPEFFVGPDGFPYLSLLTLGSGEPFEPTCLINIAENAIDQGFGAAINAAGGGADWVFSNGDLLTLHLWGRLVLEGAPSPAKLEPVDTISKGETVLVGQPSETYLPKATRANIRKFLEMRAGISEPGVYLMHRPADSPPQQLVFSVFRDQFEAEQQFMFILQGISWYLPRHYVVVALQSPDRSSGDFQPL